MRRTLAEADPEIAAAVDHEIRRQHEGLEMIASENFVSQAVLEAVGSVFTNKYAEGYPGKRYYGGCEYADVVENLARDRARQLFGADHVNVQPHSGSQANAAAYMAVINPGDTILGLDLAHGGHLTHGHKLSFSGKLYRVVFYGVDKQTERIDYDLLEATAEREKPKLIIGGGSAYPRIIDFPRMRQIADKVGASALDRYGPFRRPGSWRSPSFAGTSRAPGHHHHAQDVAGPSCRHDSLPAAICRSGGRSVFPGQQGGPLVHVLAGKAAAFREALEPEFKQYAEQVVVNARVLAETLMQRRLPRHFRGTDTHVMLVDVFSRGILGSEAENALHEAGITVNKNAIPYDVNPPLKPSGIRIGSPAMTTRGMREPEMRIIAKWISEALDHRNDPQALRRIRGQVLELVENFPLYGWLRVPETVAAEYGP